VIAAAVPYLLAVAAAQLVYTMVVVVGISALRVPLPEIVAGSFGVVGVWCMLALTAMARAGAMTALWQWGRWEKARA
jgi:Na+-driven multidrug efflux pump